MKSYIFRCNKKTKDEVFQRMLFGEEEGVWGTMSQIKPDDFLFLYNTSTFEISGPFKPTSQPAKTIEKGAWLGKFPVQFSF